MWIKIPSGQTSSFDPFCVPIDRKSTRLNSSHQAKSRILTHSACRCKNYVPKCSQFPRELTSFLFFYLVCNRDHTHSKQKKIVWKNLIEQLECTVEPYNASKCLILHYWANRVKVVTYMCTRNPAHHVARGRKHCKCMASLYKHNMGKLQSAITLILRCESKFRNVKCLVSTHSACPCKSPSAPKTPANYII